MNLPLVWIAATLAALLARRWPLAGLTIWGVIGVDAAVHIAPAIAMRRYDPGLVSTRRRSRCGRGRLIHNE